MRAFACGGHVAGRIEAGLRRHQGSLGGLHSADQRLTTAHVDQWKCDAAALARFVGEQLGLRTHGDVTLVVADATAVALADLLDFERGAYVLDTAAIRRLVDAATTADPRYTPSTIRKHMTRRAGGRHPARL